MRRHTDRLVYRISAAKRRAPLRIDTNGTGRWPWRLVLSVDRDTVARMSRAQCGHVTGAGTLILVGGVPGWIPAEV